MQLDDPAGRLHSILSQAISVPANTPCRQVWVEVLGNPPTDEVLLARLGKLMQLPNEIVELLARHYGFTDQVWGHWSTQVTRAFLTQNIEATWSTFSGHIDGHTINYLRIVSDLLKQKCGRGMAMNGDLMDLRGQLLALIDEVITSSFDDRVKNELVIRLKAVVDAIDDYRITGSFGLSRSIDAAIGSLAENSLGKALSSHELGARVAECLSAASNLVTVAVALPQLAVASAAVITAVS